RRQHHQFSASELERVWRWWKRGVSNLEIAKALGFPPASVWWQIRHRGGLAPRVRRRAERALSLGEREEISRGLATAEGVRSLARRLARAPSTISREISRHGGRARYRASDAEHATWAAGRRPKRCRLVVHRRLRRAVEQKLGLDWSPQQIAAWLVSSYPDEPTMRVSHETIYRALYVQARGAFKRSLIAHLRRGHRYRRPRSATNARRGRLVDAVSIAERPPDADDRAIPGHWEGDLLIGKRGTQIATLVERQSRFVVLVRVPAADSATVVAALARRVQQLPRALRQSLTWDRGKEMAQHAQFTIATDVQVYFCDPHSPWQRGSNENTNGLLRQYFPKGSDLRNVTQQQLDVVARKLNGRPRQTLGWKTPAEVLNATVASTG
ncbi:MAG: IS30 family transposase, partial [Gemmatimonadaceae bacterium]